MKRVVIEMWITDEAAEQGFRALAPEGGLEEMLDEQILGVRVALPDGSVLRAGQTYG